MNHFKQGDKVYLYKSMRPWPHGGQKEKNYFYDNRITLTIYDSTVYKRRGIDCLLARPESPDKYDFQSWNIPVSCLKKKERVIVLLRSNG